MAGCSDSDSSSVKRDIDVDLPEFTSEAVVSVSENQDAVIYVHVANATSVRYSIVSVYDYEKFEIDTATGQLHFKAAPDYETPTDADRDNVYVVRVLATTDTTALEQTLRITVQDVYEIDRTAPVFTSSGSVTVDENQNTAAVVTTRDSSQVRYTLVGGEDRALFSIDTDSGLLTFNSTPDYESPADSDSNNVYLVSVQAIDSFFNSAVQTLSVIVKDLDDTPPLFIISNTLSVNENQQTVMKVFAYDNSDVIYAIADTEDGSKFTIESRSGDIQFVSAPDYEHPTDENSDNVYNLTVIATDAFSNTAEASISVRVLDVDDTAPVFTSQSNIRINENQTAVTTVTTDDESTVTYSISGTSDGALFQIEGDSGLLSFRVAPDYENPTDSNQNNSYFLTVIATDAFDNVSSQLILVTVKDVTAEYSSDLDGDYIPDEIELYLGRDSEKGDEDEDGVLDGLQLTGSWGDPFFEKQWHIHSLGSYTNESGVLSIVGNDLDVLELYHQYMGYNAGDNIIVQVVDSGVDADHEDLAVNMDMSRSYDGQAVGDPSPNLTTDGYTHGTMVAGIIAAAAFNGKGVRGIIPFAKVAGSNWLETQSYTGLEKAWLSGVGANEIAVTNNSWGSPYSYDTTEEEIMALGTRDLRDGKGRIYVFAAGNDRSLDADANLQYALSNRYVIAVAALKHDMTYASYSTPGANLLVSGFGGDYHQNSPTIGTTTVAGTAKNSGNLDTQTTWSADVREDYTFAMNGTSAAAPTVTGVIALVLEACPDLTWRDVRYLIAKNAKKNDPDNALWHDNSAGFSHNNNYGFGLINPKGMIEECSAETYTNLPLETSKEQLTTVNSAIPDDKQWYSVSINMVDHLTLEWVEVTVENDSSYASDYDLYLLSPSGTKVDLIASGNGASADWIAKWMENGFRFGTPALVDEDAQGVWKLYIRDNYDGDTGTLKTVKLKVYGH